MGSQVEDRGNILNNKQVLCSLLLNLSEKNENRMK